MDRGELHGPDAVDILWAPWRMAYVSGRGRPEGCIFCVAVTGDEARHRVLARTGTALLMLNAYPYASGHLMVAPHRHVASPEELSEREHLDLALLACRALAALRATYAPDGFNLGMNLGAAAGAGVAGHLHLHVVPRWVGDTNFMPVVGAVKVIPESLEDTYRRLRPHFTAPEPGERDA